MVNIYVRGRNTDSKKYKIGFENDNLTEKINAINLPLYSTALVFLKMTNGTTPVKMEMIENNSIWSVEVTRAIVNQGSTIEAQLQIEFPDGDDVAVWQSSLFTFEVGNSINADDYIVQENPDYLEALDARVAQNASDAKESAASASASAAASEASSQTSQRAATDATNAKNEAESIASHPPTIGTDSDWLLWDEESKAYVDSNKPSRGEAATVTVGTVATGAAGSEAVVTNVSADPTNAVFDFTIPQGIQGNVMYATFEIDENGDLIMMTPPGYTGASFVLTDDGHLEVVVNG